MAKVGKQKGPVDRRALKPKPTTFPQSSIQLLDRNLFCAFLYLFLFGEQQLQDTIFILSLYASSIDLVIQVKAAFEALEGEFLADGLIFFHLCFFLLFKTDG